MANKYTAYTKITETEIECRSCHLMKPFSEFHKDSRNIRRHYCCYYCKECANNKSRSWHNTHLTDEDYKSRKRDSYIKNKHSLSLEEYQQKLQQQLYKCPICNIYLPTKGHITHLDHDHKTGILRDFLCTNCNRGLGHFQDNKEFLMNAVKYLEKHTENGTQEKESRP